MSILDETIITDDGKVVKHHIGRIIFVGLCLAMIFFLITIGTLAFMNA